MVERVLGATSSSAVDEGASDATAESVSREEVEEGIGSTAGRPVTPASAQADVSSA